MLDADTSSAALPDHRVKLFQLIRAMERYSFAAVVQQLGDQRVTLLLDSLLWGLKNEHPTVSACALRTFGDFLSQARARLPRNQFHSLCSAYYLKGLDSTLAVITDTLHTGSWSVQVRVLRCLVQLVDSDSSFPITKAQAVQTLVEKVKNSFANAVQSSAQAEHFGLGLFNYCSDEAAFDSHLRDFLLSLKRFGGQEDLWRAARDRELAKSREKDMLNKRRIPGFVGVSSGTTPTCLDRLPDHDREKSEDDTL